MEWVIPLIVFLLVIAFVSTTSKNLPWFGHQVHPVGGSNPGKIVVPVPLTEELHAQLLAAAVANHTSISEVILAAVRSTLAQESKP